jgi:hypothetical protein
MPSRSNRAEIVMKIIVAIWCDSLRQQLHRDAVKLDRWPSISDNASMSKGRPRRARMGLSE